MEKSPSFVSRAIKVISLVFIVVFLAELAVLTLKPKKYEAHMSFLLRNERADLLVSTDRNQNTVEPGGVTEEQVNSEAEFLTSTELLQGVVKACGLDKDFHDRDDATNIEEATRKLSKNLIVTPVRKSALINVSYDSTNRDGSVLVLNELAAEYLAKQLTLHTSGSAAAFFRQKSIVIAGQLRATEDRRTGLLEQNGFTLVAQQRQLLMQQMLEIRRSRDDVQSSLDETSSRLAVVMRQIASNEARVTTQSRMMANQYSVERLNTMLAEMQNRRTELVTKFRPGDKLIAQIDKEVADTRRALDNAQKIQSEDTTTDINPIRQTLDAEAVRLQQVQAGLRSKKEDLDRFLSRQKVEIGTMERASVDLDDTDRDIKQLDASLDLYRSKAVAAGMDEDLDTAKISNVVIASRPLVPVLPPPSPFNYLTALLAALVISLSVGFLWDARCRRVEGEANNGVKMGEMVSLHL